MTDLSVFLAGSFPAFALAVHLVGEYRKATGKGVGKVFKIVDKTLTVLVLIEVAFLVLMFSISWWVSTR
jgi:hypothetical protein